MPALLHLRRGRCALALLLASFMKLSSAKIPFWPCVLIVGGLTVAGYGR